MADRTPPVQADALAKWRVTADDRSHDKQASAPRSQSVRRISYNSLRWSIAGIDLLAGVILAVLIFLIYAAPKGYDFAQLISGVALFIPCWLLAANITGIYRQRLPIMELRQALPALSNALLAYGMLLLLTFALSLSGHISRVWLLSWAVSTCLCTVLSRLLIRTYIRRALARDMCFERVLVTGNDHDAAAARARELEIGTKGAIRAVEVIASDVQEYHARIETCIQHNEIDRVFFVERPSEALLNRLARYSITLSIMPALGFNPVHIERVAGHVVFDLTALPWAGGRRLAKKLEDVGIALFALLLFSPFMIACAIAIRLDSPGPILFRQLRVGYNGRKFALLKFRSMYEDASDPGAVQQTSRADPRVTRIGRFMRATSLDELPQLINVLRGEMSLVGPRPHALAMTAEGIPVDLAANDYAFRHRVKPGMTGWAQVNGSRGEVSTVAQLARRTELDLWYIQHASVGLDLWILLRTVNIVILNPGAY